MASRSAAIGIWAAALVAYGIFALWYGGWRGPLTPAEIAAHLAILTEGGAYDAAQLAGLRAFLEADDGGEFFMVNLVRLQPGEITVPGTEETSPAPRVMERYTRPFMRELFQRAGHPAFVAPAAGTYLERWGIVEPDPGWTFAGVIRYRSRRDVIEMVVDPVFEPIHAYKIAAVAQTLAFPTAPARIWIGPRVLVPLLLGLIAALAHVALLSSRLRRYHRTKE